MKVEVGVGSRFLESGVDFKKFRVEVGCRESRVEIQLIDVKGNEYSSEMNFMILIFSYQNFYGHS